MVSFESDLRHVFEPSGKKVKKDNQFRSVFENLNLSTIRKNVCLLEVL